MTLGYVKVIFMRTGKHQFNYYKYAVIWAEKILAEDSRYSLSKAYEIDRYFGALLESTLTELKRQQKLRDYINKKLVLIAYFYDKFMVRLNQEEAKIMAQVKQLQNYAKDLSADYSSMTTKDFLTKYADRDWIIDMSDIGQSLYEAVLNDINQAEVKAVQMIDYLTNSVQRAYKVMKEVLNED